MKIEIFNVKAGQCAMVHCPNGKRVMIDAGHNADIPWLPSVHFKGVDIDNLIVTNYDEDHVSDFVDLRKNCGSLRLITKNNSVDPPALLSLKGGVQGMGPGIKAIYDWMRTPPNSVPPSDLGDVTVETYWNDYGTFDDTNNLSVATFFHYGNFTILFPGDLEVAGWEELLKDIEFQRSLRRVTLLVASHHGRENGCCEDIFDYCSPKAVIISDDSKKYSTQETRDWYASKVSGCKDTKGNNREVFTTRSDGNILIDVNPASTWNIGTEK